MDSREEGWELLDLLVSPALENIRNICSKPALLRRPGGISVQYSLNFEVNSLKSSSEGAEAATELPEPSLVSRLKQMVTKALQEEASLPIDLDTLRFDPGRWRTSRSSRSRDSAGGKL